MSDDITFCLNRKCKNKKCDRHYKNIKHKLMNHSFAAFTKCKYWEKEGKHDGES